MPAVLEFLNSLKEFQKSCHMLNKCNDFLKQHSKSKQSDFCSFCSVEDTEHCLQRELTALVEESNAKSWNFIISSYHIDKERVSLKLDRPAAIKFIFLEVCESRNVYGRTTVFQGKVIAIECGCRGAPLAQLRVRKAAQVAAALVTLGGGSVAESSTAGTELVRLDHSLINLAVTPADISEEEFIQLRTEDMMAMADHKELSEQSVSQLVDAAVVFDLLSIRLDKPLSLDLSPHPKASRQTNSKGAAYVLYNYARLCAILDRYDHCVAKGIFRPLPALQELDYSLFKEEDEWGLVFDLVAEWPAVVCQCQDLSQLSFHRLTGFLSSLASTFSVYYRHTRVLNEGLDHLLPLMEARIHLLLAIKQVFSVAFSLLGIQPPTVM